MEEDEGQKQETAQGRKGDAWTEGRGRPGQVQKDTALALPSHLCPLTGGWSGTSGCCAPSLASTGTQLPPRLCGHQLPEPCSAAAAAPRTPGAVFGEAVTARPHSDPLSLLSPRALNDTVIALFEDHGDL